ncbi:ankyrin repeat domain containing protein [Elaphomyces granulatus]
MMEDQTVAINDKGLTVLVEPDNPVVDIVFIHGFTGHPKETWTMKNCGKFSKRNDPENAEIDKHGNVTGSSPSKYRKLLSSVRSKVSTPAPTPAFHGRSSCANGSGRLEVYWPRDLLPRTAPDARILTYGYDTKIRHLAIGPVSQNTVYDHGWNFLCAVEEFRRKEPLRPLLLVAHSLGGLIVKEALRKSRDCEWVKPHLHNIVRSIVGVLFFGTPHHGANPLGLIRRTVSELATGFGFRLNNKIVDTLMPGGEHLKVSNEFTGLARQGQWIIYCFQEEYGLQGLLGRKVVDDESSSLHDPAIETPRHISSNHMNMCRFSGTGDPEYQKVAAAIERVLQDLSTKLQPGLVRLDGIESGDSARPRTPVVPPQWSRTGDNHQTDNFCPVLETTDPGQADARQNLIDLLQFDQIDARLITLKTAQAKTCRWFLWKPEYTDWMCVEKLQDHHGFLWIKGKPGAGKSILMKFLFSNAKDSAKANPNTLVISFFFNARGDHLEKSTIGLYRSLLFQIFEKAPDLQGILDGLGRNARRLIQDHGWQIETLKDALAKAVEGLGNRSLICFIDALDECNEEQVADMISFFEDIGEHASDVNTRLHICFSSRHYPTIVIQRGFEVTLEDEQEHVADISRYIKSKLRLGNSKQADALRSDIQEKSAGIFLWVALVIEILNTEYAGGRVSALRDRLRDIPPGLDELFEMILTRDGKNMQELQLCIQWVLFAVRPLKPQELYFAVHFGAGQSISISWDTDSISLNDIHRFVQSSSKGLAEVSKSKKPTVQFIHESVRDFLFKDGKWKLWPTLAEQFVGRSHDILKDCCLAQIDASQDINVLTDADQKDSQALKGLRQAIQSEHPFLEYATMNALVHSNQAQSVGIAQNTFVTAFPLQHWIKLINVFEEYQVRRYTNKASLLYILAERNLASLIEVHPHAHDHFDIHGERYGYPFIAAAVLRNEDAVRELVRAVLPDQPGVLSHLHSNLDGLPHGRNFQPPKHHILFTFLADFGHVGILRYILDKDSVDLELHEQGQTMLTFAAGKGYEKVVNLLLEKGAELDPKDRHDRTPLSRAADSGHEVVVKLLVEKGAELDSRDKYIGRTPLSRAAEGGHEAVVNLLLEKGAELDSKDNPGATPLSWAALCGREAVVKLLIEKGAELDSKDKDGRTPLSWAARQDHEAVVKLLIEKGAELGSRDKDGRTPLSWAAYHGYKAVVKLLIEKGAVT